MKKTDDKTKKKNWVDGDTFAVKIENCSKEFNGQYLILTFYKSNSTSYCRFRCKIAKTIPTNIEELNLLEYIKVDVFPLEYGVLQLKDKSNINEINELQNKSDEFGYLNTYLFEIRMRRDGDYSMFYYIGNYDITIPFNEYLPPTLILMNLPNTKYPETLSFIQKLVDCYANFNLKESKIYRKEGIKAYHDDAIFLLKAFDFLSKQDNNNSNIINGWGPKLYDSDVALDIKADYSKYFRKSKKKNQSNIEMIQELCDYYEDYITDPIDGPLFWIILTDLQMKNNLLTEDLKKLALDSIEKDLDNWKGTKVYTERKEELDKFKEKLQNYVFKK